MQTYIEHIVPASPLGLLITLLTLYFLHTNYVDVVILQFFYNNYQYTIIIIFLTYKHLTMLSSCSSFTILIHKQQVWTI